MIEPVASAPCWSLCWSRVRPGVPGLYLSASTPEEIASGIVLAIDVTAEDLSLGDAAAHLMFGAFWAGPFPVLYPIKILE